MKYFLCATAICTIAGLQAQSPALSSRVYSASLQNTTSTTVTEIRSYLKQICEADSVIYEAATGNFEIYTKKALETNVVAGKLQKNFTPLTAFTLKKAPEPLQQSDTRQTFEIINDLEFVSEAAYTDFSHAKTITLHFEPFEKGLPAGYETKILENISGCQDKLQLVSMTNGSITFKYINQSPKEIMMYFKAKELPDLYYMASDARKFKLMNNAIQAL
jgi:hypothetical protein